MKTRDFYRKVRGRRINRLLMRDGNLCHLCGKALDRRVYDERSPDYITFDHVVPASRGGLTVMRNLRLAHLRCNAERGNRLLESA